MSKQSEQWKPYNLNKGPHVCKQKNGNGNGNSNELSLDVVLKKLESIGITVDPREVEECEMKKTHCESCGEWLDGYDICSSCGRINVEENR